LQPGKRMYGEKGQTSSNVVYDAPYTGPVYCVGVPRHHTLYTRFNGKPVWSGNSWDGSGIEHNVEMWRLCYDLLPPGGHLLAFGGTRTWHRIASAIEDAGFEIRDTLMWMYGTGFPKSHDVSKGIDKALGATGTFGGPKSAAHAGWIDRGRIRGEDGHEGWQRPYLNDPEAVDRSAREYLPGSEAAQRYKGWGTALKPAWEPVIVARKPLAGTVAQNVLAHGTGAINIDGCRIAAQGRPAREVAPLRDDVTYQPNSLAGRVDGSLQSSKAVGTTDVGRWPANVVHDGSDEVEAAFAAFGEAPGQIAKASSSDTRKNQNVYGEMARGSGHAEPRQDRGTASRFYYTAKASKADRGEGNLHPTVKPTALMQWLVRMVTPPGGTVLDPFMGSGSTGKAAALEGFDFIGIEQSADYIRIARSRIPGAAEDLPALLAAAAQARQQMTHLLSVEALRAFGG